MSKKSRKPRKDSKRAGEASARAAGPRSGPSHRERHAMQPDTPHADGHPDLRDGAAAIAPVTDAMMDHAARGAAEMADAAARGTAALEGAAESAADLSGQAAAAAAESTETLVEAAGDAAVDAVRRAQTSAETLAEAAVDEAGRAAARGTEAARDALSASSDALGQYNAKVMEIMSSNLASTTELFAALVQAKSVPEAMSLNADHLRRRMEALTGQGRDLATLAQRIALDALQPFKGSGDR